VASRPSRIIWSNEALSSFQELGDLTREQILRRVALLRQYPMMYQVEMRGQWAGLRRFIAAEVVVFHTYWQQDHTVYIEAIVPARSGER
jgi:hypothetical protein